MLASRRRGGIVNASESAAGSASRMSTSSASADLQIPTRPLPARLTANHRTGPPTGARAQPRLTPTGSVKSAHLCVGILASLPRRRWAIPLDSSPRRFDDAPTPLKSFDSQFVFNHCFAATVEEWFHGKYHPRYLFLPRLQRLPRFPLYRSIAPVIPPARFLIGETIVVQHADEEFHRCRQPSQYECHH